MCNGCIIIDAGDTAYKEGFKKRCLIIRKRLNQLYKKQKWKIYQKDIYLHFKLRNTQHIEGYAYIYVSILRICVYVSKVKLQLDCSDTSTRVGSMISPIHRVWTLLMKSSDNTNILWIHNKNLYSTESDIRRSKKARTHRRR